MRLAFWLACVLVSLIATALSQERFGREEFSGELRGFTKSGTEHIIEHWPEVLTVASVSGEIRAATNDEPLANALFEIRGPGESERVVGTKTNRDGAFRLKKVRAGAYAFKVTLNGFQSVVGRLCVVPRAKAGGTGTIKIKLNLGV